MEIRFCERKKDDPSSAMRGGRQSATGNWQPEQKDGSNVAPAAGKTGGRAGGRTDPATGLDEDCRRFQSHVLSSGLNWHVAFSHSSIFPISFFFQSLFRSKYLKIHLNYF
jgi:hypothetical protein